MKFESHKILVEDPHYPLYVQYAYMYIHIFVISCLHRSQTAWSFFLIMCFVNCFLAFGN
jgi:hypothetical protein